MHTRRDFLKYAAALPAAAVAARSAWALERVPLGVQLFTVRREAQRNLPHVLDQIRKIGYQEVESYAGLYTFSAAALHHMIRGAGLRVPSGHFNYSDFGSRFNYAMEMGLQWMVCPMIEPSMWGSPQGFRTAAKQFNVWGRRAKEMEMRFAFHNHDYEFRPFPGASGAQPRYGYEILINETDPELVFFEVDVYWVAQAGHDPLSLMRTLGPRLKMLHLKDRAAGARISFDMGQDANYFMPVGAGTLDWHAILAEGERLGVEHYFVEQDQTRGPEIRAVRYSYRYLESILQGRAGSRPGSAAPAP